MRFTLHSRHHMSQRGIPQRLVVESLQAELRLAMHVLDKGGVTVVEDGGGVITTWNREQPTTRPQAVRLSCGPEAFQ